VLNAGTQEEPKDPCLNEETGEPTQTRITQTRARGRTGTHSAPRILNTRPAKPLFRMVKRKRKRD
jgi:hypothetical protein